MIKTYRQSRSSVQVPVDGVQQAALGDDGDDTALDADLSLPRHGPSSHLGQTGALRLIVSAAPDAKRQRFTP